MTVLLMDKFLKRTMSLEKVQDLENPEHQVQVKRKRLELTRRLVRQLREQTQKAERIIAAQDRNKSTSLTTQIKLRYTLPEILESKESIRPNNETCRGLYVIVASNGDVPV
ncbi:unnamed protein product [Acanthoscelides obtectus]|uniref:Uncharacterized protein n=1 Tax=Acanthoscelides obtectus TaxID=200917 RepID=A0A9P0LMK7_ACAOB|nr:unnamed protein product [Acanthoscelides obtectus]CAK1683241.1 hypothetical protein AOBTE_LOCUS34158 [Acanthoscelides obtectus]